MSVFHACPLTNLKHSTSWSVSSLIISAWGSLQKQKFPCVLQLVLLSLPVSFTSKKQSRSSPSLLYLAYLKCMLAIDAHLKFTVNGQSKQTDTCVHNAVLLAWGSLGLMPISCCVFIWSVSETELQSSLKKKENVVRIWQTLLHLHNNHICL